jgi:hypothetical protein
MMVLVWQFGSVFALTMLGCCSGRFILNWRSLTGDRMRPAA